MLFVTIIMDKGILGFIKENTGLLCYFGNHSSVSILHHHLVFSV